jgi:ribosomal-protein-alanine N-acetyltransferase
MTAVSLRTERLLLRPWEDDDVEPFAEMGQDPEVMVHMPGLLDPMQSQALVLRVRAHFAKHGWGLWAVEVPQKASFIGFVGLQWVPFESHFTPAVEVGWRLARPHWGHGYATEAARAAVEFGFDEAGLEEVVGMTVPANVRSQRVMERIGMMRDEGGDFEHPRVPEGHPLKRHILYRVRARPSAA